MAGRRRLVETYSFRNIYHQIERLSLLEWGRFEYVRTSFGRQMLGIFKVLRPKRALQRDYTRTMSQECRKEVLDTILTLTKLFTPEPNALHAVFFAILLEYQQCFTCAFYRTSPNSTLPSLSSPLKGQGKG